MRDLLFRCVTNKKDKVGKLRKVVSLFEGREGGER